GWETLQLPFTVALEDFVVERDEGGEHVAGWISKVRFTDPVSGNAKRVNISMNRPAVFRGYRFSQASWDPQDLQYSVLQVKKDPWWVVAVTWTGSGMTIFGIALTFYGRRWLAKA
ncbi:MAG: cytochrome c biogenesis protein ResB, partial [Verrucomicrobiae bacterium]|nr:cytochrome c biogenesis protein ResB [Verrucomicrobiae bacterium]